MKVPRRSEEKKDRSYIGHDEVKIFLNAIKGDPLEVSLILTLFYGFRRKEVVGLKWDAIHSDGKLYVEHTVALANQPVAKDRTKNDASYRAYPIPDWVAEKLAAIRKEQERNRKLFEDSYNESGYMFTREDGRPYRPDYLTKRFKKLVRADERLDDSLTLHSLRASCVSILIHEGVDIKDVQAWVGHRDVQTTLNIYARTNEARKEKTADLLSTAMFLENS